MDAPVRLLAISGSLRRESFNTRLLRYAQTHLLPTGAEMELVTLHDIPPYDDDIYRQGFPPAVAALREKIRSAEAVVISTPEYNYSIPGVLKNAIDWCSRAPEQPWRGKPVALMSATGGFAGGPRAQFATRLVLAAVQAVAFAGDEVFIGSASDKFDAEGQLTDPRALKGVAALLEQFVASVKAHRRLED